MKETYCGTIGYEYMHIPDRDMCNWQGLALALGTATRSNRS
jgi:2-oxoglutarate dehydrogenase E1 component